MKAGTLRHRITIQQRPATRDAAGQRTGDWVATATDRPAFVRELTGREYRNTQQVMSDVTNAIEMRGFANWRDSIKPSMRVVFDGRIFDIKHAINPDGKNVQLIIYATEIVG